MNGTWRPWDDPEEDGDDYTGDHDDLAALDFSSPDDRGPDADVFGHPAPNEETGDDDAPPLFTVTNPPATVAVTAHLNGCVERVDLAPNVTRMTERQLAEEIGVIADLARMKARSVLHTFFAESMRRSGYDTADMSASLTRDLDMPTPDQAAEVTAHVFATRYTSDQD